jgi:hypothetical protein
MDVGENYLPDTCAIPPSILWCLNHSSKSDSNHRENKMKKITGASIVLLALVIGLVPLFTDCLSQGRSLTTTTGMSVPMKCHWTALAEIGVAIPLALVGIMTIFSKRKETSASMGIFGVTLGALAIAFPTFIIGVCANPSMFCNMAEKPALILSGILAMAVSGVVLVNSRKMVEPSA